MARKFSYKGKTLEELKAMSLADFVLLLDARSRRSVKRLDHRYRDLLAKAKKVGDRKPIKTTIREAVILPEWIGLTFAIHRGKEFKEIKVEAEMVGHRLGEFAHTTVNVKHSGPGVGATRGSKFLPLK
ncbi:MAG: 30S ribosomal protein S19 [Proteobacteria bacterium]|nr:30S ribosomal protein S19 [Pseudomonadota bacterium]